MLPLDPADFVNPNKPLTGSGNCRRAVKFWLVVPLHLYMYTLLKQSIIDKISIPDAEMEAFCNLFCLKTLKKKEFFLREGDISRYEAFVKKGLFKVYHLDEKGTEHILYFAPENWWLVDIDSFHNNVPSMLYIEAIEDCEILVISQSDKEFANQTLPSIEKLFRIMTQKAYVNLQRRMIRNLSKTADHRYQDFIKRYPDLAVRLNNLQISAYLGISHEFLSKIRKKMVSKK